MKIAICLSGQPRGIPTGCDFLLEYIIKPNNIKDVFIHTWYDPKYNNLPFDSAQPNKSNTLGTWNPRTVEILQEKLNPTVLLTESPRDFREYSHLKGTNSADQTKLISKFYSEYKANELKLKYENDNNFKYDVVIKTRIDMIYYSPIIISDIIDENIHNAVYVPQMHQYMRDNDSYPTTSGGVYSSMTDVFFVCSSYTMDLLSDSLFLEFAKHHSELFPYVYGESYMGYVARKVYKLPIVSKNIICQIYRGHN